MHIATMLSEFELDRSENRIKDISVAYLVSAEDSSSMNKCYFTDLSSRKELASGCVYCSLILAQSQSFSMFMEIAQPLLMDQKASLWTKDCDHETVADTDWLLCSTHEKDLGTPIDKMETFFFSETLKCLYLLFNSVDTYCSTLKCRLIF